MANQSKLKAWLRYDGTGRVVTAGPIFQANKPKVGNWRQMNIDLCCNPSGSTTTTTTAGGGGGVTPTAFVNFYYINTYNACNSTIDGTLVYYSASTTLQAGITVFSDAALTTPITEGYVIYTAAEGNFRYLVGPGGLLSLYTCSFLIQVSASNTSREEACSAPPVVNVYSSSPSIGVYSNIYIDSNLTIPAPYAYVGANGNSYQCINGNLQSEQSCVVVNSQTFYLGGDPGIACLGVSSQILYWNGTFQSNGTVVYTDPQLTQTLPTGVYIVNPNTSAVYLISNGAAFANGFCGQ